MSSITIHPSSRNELTDDALKLRLETALYAFAASPDDVWVSAGCCFNAITAAVDASMRWHSFARSELMSVVDCMNASLQDFEEPDQLARDVTAMLYYFVETAALDLELTPPPHFREAVYYAMLRTFSRDLDLLPFRMWQLAHALYDAARHDDRDRTLDIVAEIRTLVLTSPPADEDPRYHHEPDQHFLNTSDEEDEEDLTPLSSPIVVRNFNDPTIPLSEVLWSTDDARRRLERLMERERALRHHLPVEHPDAVLLAARIDFTRRHIAWVEGMNANRRAERVKQLH